MHSALYLGTVQKCEANQLFPLVQADLQYNRVQARTYFSHYLDII